MSAMYHRCEVCNAEAWLVSDHCHEREEREGVRTHRGYLCTSCNVTLGKYRDSREALKEKADALQKRAEILRELAHYLMLGRYP
ncbi:endonuclease domain-containing protein [Mesorhizobium sp.]|uniref:endonuclease domain-containing protein n=1 Tax=Mesorhizobium sp. TaxID=1871066 RepID=UPI0011FC1721|nr:endonuclease domain-containing protein [Mesorhizobium sp.]TIL48842.1 MAG: hypothetical protein E5Y83_29350 [Mesorhizobium sp.]